MKASQFLISTLKEAPADAEVASHQLMLRAGMIKRLAAGIYTYMPMGLRVIRKVEAIVREEMNRAGAIERAPPVIGREEIVEFLVEAELGDDRRGVGGGGAVEEEVGRVFGQRVGQRSAQGATQGIGQGGR